ncbi:MAG: T9SS type A sorting domain-containing protein [Bacteroidia bacterium]|nr:T9SS type A sorting domain-containing protein [Bacteroidia bacterium]
MKKILPLIFCVCQLILSAQSYNQTLLFGTGEYDPNANWHGILRMDNSQTYNSGTALTQYTPDGVVPIKSCYDSTVFLNFAHGMYYHNSADRIYLSTLFTNQTNTLTTNTLTAVGSIAVFDNGSSMNGATSPTRHIFGSNTGLTQPHGCWLDESRDILYVANTFGGNILVFDNASTIDGNVAPNRTISYSTMGKPVYIFCDEANDRIFVTCMNMGAPPGVLPKVVVYNNASTLSGTSQTPSVTIQGSNTRLGFRNPTVHNCWYNSTNGILAVGHHTHELLMFDLNSLNLNPGTPSVNNLSPRVIKINEMVNDLDTINHNLYGFYWDLATDTMYVSDGWSGSAPGMQGGPQPGTANKIRVFGNVSSAATSGIVAPARTICWSNSTSYWPPQPVWLKKISTSGINDVFNIHSDVFIFPNPATTILTVSLSNLKGKKTECRIFDLSGKLLKSEIVIPEDEKQNITLNISELADGVYFVKVKAEAGERTMKLLKY